MANMHAWGACDSGFESQCTDQTELNEFCGQLVCSLAPNPPMHRHLKLNSLKFSLRYENNFVL